MEKKKEKIVSTVATIGIVLTLFGATYAYFVSRTDAGKTTGVEITANTVDVFSFETGDSITLSLDQESFAEGTGDKSGSTFAKATLTPNNKTNTATDNYYVYLNISDNTFSYSLGSDKPEILLQVTDADGATVTSLDGLSYSTVTNGAGESVSGFDITTKTGLITLANNKEITANTTTKEDTWNIRVVFINYNEDQSGNAGNNFKAKLMIQEEIIPQTIGDTCKNGDNLASCVTKLYSEDILGLNNLYYHDSTLANGAGDNSYRYAGSNYKLTEKAILENFSKIRATDSTSTDTLINHYCNHEKVGMYFNCRYSSDYYSLQYDSSNIQYARYAEAEKQALNDGYLTNNVNNFVCFGSDAATCPDDNLYRIIGVFGDQVKLIKWDYANSDLLGTDGDYSSETYSAERVPDYTGAKTTINGYYWNNANYSATYSATNCYNVWSYSKLNTINLNTNFINNIGTEWSNKIAETTWKVGGNTWDNISSGTPATAFTSEITNPDTTIESSYQSKIALMYASDYGFAASPSAWTTPLYNYDNNDSSGNKITEKNWMYMGIYEWTVTRYSNDGNSSFYVHGRKKGQQPPSEGDVVEGSYAVRPVFHLESSVNYASGDGSKNSPIRID